jgi:hypothetical protein
METACRVDHRHHGASFVPRDGANTTAQNTQDVGTPRPAPSRAAHLDGRADSGAVANLADSGARGVAATPISSERPPTRPPPSSAAYLPPPRTQAGRQAQGRAGIQ